MVRDKVPRRRAIATEPEVEAERREATLKLDSGIINKRAVLAIAEQADMAEWLVRALNGMPKPKGLKPYSEAGLLPCQRIASMEEHFERCMRLVQAAKVADDLLAKRMKIWKMDAGLEAGDG